jgi:proteasome regulatory subunit
MIDFPMPDEEARKSIFKIHTRTLNIEGELNIKKLVELTEGATGADIKAICTEAGMFAIRKEARHIIKDDFFDAVDKVMNKMKDKAIQSRMYT